MAANRSRDLFKTEHFFILDVILWCFFGFEKKNHRCRDGQVLDRFVFV